MKKILLSFVFVCAVIAAYASDESCSHWNDTGTNIALPEEIAGMRMKTRVTYGKDDHSYSYHSDTDKTGRMIKKLDVYIYKRDGADLNSDGVGESVRKEMNDIVSAAMQLNNFKTIGNVATSPIGVTQCLISQFSGNDISRAQNIRSWALLCSFRANFFELRYTEYANDANGKPCKSSWPDIVQTFGSVLDRAKHDRDVNIYAIDNSTNRLEAICKKWIGADEQNKKFQLPQYHSAFDEINKAIAWCKENPKERYGELERIMRWAIDQRIDPAVCYYKLACALAVQGKTDAAFEALEQAVSAGYGTVGGAKRAQVDSDMSSLTNDLRFAKLCSAMDSDTRCSVKGENPLQDVD